MEGFFNIWKVCDLWLNIIHKLDPEWKWTEERKKEKNIRPRPSQATEPASIYLDDQLNLKTTQFCCSIVNQTRLTFNFLNKTNNWS